MDSHLTIKLYTHTMADERDVICNTKFLKNIKPKVNKEKYKQVVQKLHFAPKLE